MKKLIALLLAMVMVVGLCACGDKEEKKTPADQGQNIVNDALDNADVDVDMDDAMEGLDDDALAELEDALADLEDIDFGDDFDIDVDELVVDVTGRYDMTSITMDGETLSIEEYADLMSAAGFECYVELYSDGTAYMYTSDGETSEGMDMGWGDDMMWPADDPSDTASCIISGNTLTISQDGMEMIFKK